MLSPVPAPTPSKYAILIVAGLVIVAFFIATIDLRRESLWNDEAWTAWAVRSPYIRDTLERVRADVHPPLYFVLLGALGRFSGDSALALRWPSAFFAMLALASTYALGKQLFDRRTGIIALILLGSASFFVYYAREARMYSLLMALAALATLLYVRWRAKPTLWRTLLYALSISALLYTHYAGAFIIGSHLLHALILQLAPKTRHRPKWYTIPLPYIIALMLYIPWLPIFLNQMRNNPNGPLAIPLPTNWNTVAALILILTSGSAGLMVAPFVLGNALPRLRQYASAALLLILWLLVTPICLLALNLWFAPVYQVRYAIAMLPAGALLLAYGLRHIHIPHRLVPSSNRSRYVAVSITVVLVSWIAALQLTMYKELWPPKPAWEATIKGMIDARQLLDATITHLADYSPAAYYDRQLGLRQGVGLDLAWRQHTPDEVNRLVAKLDSEPVVWAALPVNIAKSWQVVAQLDEERGIGYRSSLGNMVFYQFSRDRSDDLQFQFGDLVRLDGKLVADEHLSATAGEQVCVTIAMQTLTTIDNAYSVGLHLVDITGSLNIAQSDNGFGPHTAHEALTLNPCLTTPAETAPGAYHLEFTFYNWATVERVPVVETSSQPVGWGDVLMMQSVEIQAPK